MIQNFQYFIVNKYLDEIRMRSQSEESETIAQDWELINNNTNQE